MEHKKAEWKNFYWELCACVEKTECNLSSGKTKAEVNSLTKSKELSCNTVAFHEAKYCILLNLMHDIKTRKLV